MFSRGYYFAVKYANSSLVGITLVTFDHQSLHFAWRCPCPWPWRCGIGIKEKIYILGLTLTLTVEVLVLRAVTLALVSVESLLTSLVVCSILYHSLVYMSKVHLEMLALSICLRNSFSFWGLPPQPPYQTHFYDRFHFESPNCVISGGGHVHHPLSAAVA